MLCCIRAPGDTDGGEGLVMVMPVRGLMMGMALRARVAEGWCSFRVDDCWLWKVGGMKGGEDEFNEKAGVTWMGCEGECSSFGEPLETDDLSEDALWMDTYWAGYQLWLFHHQSWKQREGPIGQRGVGVWGGADCAGTERLRC